MCVGGEGRGQLLTTFNFNVNILPTPLTFYILPESWGGGQLQLYSLFLICNSKKVFAARKKGDSPPPSNATCLKVINYNHHLIITVSIKKYETTTTERLIIVWTQQTVGFLFHYYALRFMHFYKTLWNSLQRCCFNCVTVFLSLPYNIALRSRSRKKRTSVQ